MITQIIFTSFNWWTRVLKISVKYLLLALIKSALWLSNDYECNFLKFFSISFSPAYSNVSTRIHFNSYFCSQNCSIVNPHNLLLWIKGKNSLPGLNWGQSAPVSQTAEDNYSVIHGAADTYTPFCFWGTGVSNFSHIDSSVMVSAQPVSSACSAAKSPLLSSGTWLFAACVHTASTSQETVFARLC